jgi:hypothetical protein
VTDEARGTDGKPSENDNKKDVAAWMQHAGQSVTSDVPSQPKVAKEPIHKQHGHIPVLVTRGGGSRLAQEPIHVAWETRVNTTRMSYIGHYGN